MKCLTIGEGVDDLAHHGAPARLWAFLPAVAQPHHCAQGADLGESLNVEEGRGGGVKRYGTRAGRLESLARVTITVFASRTSPLAS